ncbi:hypothetical protein BDQ12DRAFT_709132 [Crucibulum laeve]|uniref:Uncharacterized protein n=1 Tax=Crucibulum laeve TaxID=68775 RepID=A0A5C3MEJ4_9AGAR|nr:hypothetical protein BDQ12DRAFT_709132 [Crucibulum laeve]
MKIRLYKPRCKTYKSEWPQHLHTSTIQVEGLSSLARVRDFMLHFQTEFDGRACWEGEPSPCCLTGNKNADRKWVMLILVSLGYNNALQILYGPYYPASIGSTLVQGALTGIHAQPQGNNHQGWYLDGLYCASFGRVLSKLLVICYVHYFGLDKPGEQNNPSKHTMASDLGKSSSGAD